MHLLAADGIHQEWLEADAEALLEVETLSLALTLFRRRTGWAVTQLPQSFCVQVLAAELFVIGVELGIDEVVLLEEVKALVLRCIQAWIGVVVDGGSSGDIFVLVAANPWQYKG